MNQPIDPHFQTHQFITLMRSIKGAPLSVFLYLATAYRALGRNELVIFTGYGKDSVTRALLLLESTGIAIHEDRYNSWMLNPDLKQLKLSDLYNALPILAPRSPADNRGFTPNQSTSAPMALPLYPESDPNDNRPDPPNLGSATQNLSPDSRSHFEVAKNDLPAPMQVVEAHPVLHKAKKTCSLFAYRQSLLSES